MTFESPRDRSRREFDEALAEVKAQVRIAIEPFVAWVDRHPVLFSAVALAMVSAMVAAIIVEIAK